MSAIITNVHDAPSQNPKERLAAKLQSARREGLAAPGRRRTDVEALFDAQQVVSMGERLPVIEIEALGEATELRESGLTAARLGDLEAADALIRQARKLIAAVSVCREAQLMADTYQLAAEAFVDYRRSCLDSAEEKMLGSMTAAIALSKDFGYTQKMRIVHLGRNVARLQCVRGETGKAADAAVGLLYVTLGDDRRWPWPAMPLDPAESLSTEYASFVIDQVLCEICLIALHNATAQALAELETVGFRQALIARGFANDLNDQVMRVLASLRADRNNEPIAAILEHAAAYLQAGPEDMPQTWRAFERFLAARCAIAGVPFE